MEIFLIEASKPGVPELDFKVIKKFHCIFKTFLKSTPFFHLLWCAGIKLLFTCGKVSLHLFLNAVTKTVLYFPIKETFQCETTGFIPVPCFGFSKIFRNQPQKVCTLRWSSYIKTSVSSFPTLSVLSAMLVTLREDGH